MALPVVGMQYQRPMGHAFTQHGTLDYRTAVGRILGVEDLEAGDLAAEDIEDP
jgi:hypothetical protein